MSEYLTTEYRTRPDPRDLEPFFSRHMMAMTAEELDSKADIAMELAYRDKRIALLEAEVAALCKADIKRVPTRDARIKELEAENAQAKHTIAEQQRLIAGLQDARDYWKERVFLLEAAIRKHREDMRESLAHGWPEDNELYAVLQEKGNE